MSGPRKDPTLDRIWSGDPLGSADERHVATCGACQRATSEVRLLEARLREATQPMASTPIPDEVFEVEPMRATVQERIGGRSMGLAAAAVVVLAVVAAGLAVSPWRPSVAIDPSAVATPTDQSSPLPTATTAPSPAPTPTAPADQTDAHLVGPGGICADGRGGYTVRLPDATYAERADGQSPACRVFGGVGDSGGRQNLEPRIYATVVERPPPFEGATIVSEETRTSDGGTMMLRYEVRTPETGALAASHTVTYVVPGPGGQFLQLETQAGDEAWVGRLDALALSIRLTQPMTASEDAVAVAASLFAVRDVCEDPERGLVVTFPEDWWTNTAVEDLPACSWFAPSFFEYESSATVPEEVEITVEIVDGDVGTTTEPTGWETLTLLGRPATRWLVQSDGAPHYAYVVQLGETSEAGPNLVARTVATRTDLDLAMAVLDRLVQHITFAQPPPGASSTNPPISAEPVSAEKSAGDFRLELSSSRGGTAPASRSSPT